MLRQASGFVLPGESAVLALLTGKTPKRGKLRVLAEDLHWLFVVPEDGETVGAPLEPWKLEGGKEGIREEEGRKKLEITDLWTLCKELQKEADRLLRTTATMTVAIPDYNHRVKKSLFPTKTWSKAHKQKFNKVMYRLECEVEMWELCLNNLSEPQ